MGKAGRGQSRKIHVTGKYGVTRRNSRKTARVIVNKYDPVDDPVKGLRSLARAAAGLDDYLGLHYPQFLSAFQATIHTINENIHSELSTVLDMIQLARKANASATPAGGAGAPAPVPARASANNELSRLIRQLSIINESKNE